VFIIRLNCCGSGTTRTDTRLVQMRNVTGMKNMTTAGRRRSLCAPRSLSPLILALLMSAAPATAQNPTQVRLLLDEAAARFDIPRPILYGVSYNESRWRQIPVDSLTPSCTGMPPSYGLMGLHDDDYFGHSLRAAEKLGIPADSAASNLEANIVTGAYHISMLFDGTDRANLSDWMGAVAAYSGIPADRPAFRLLYVDGVLELLRRGWAIGERYIAPTHDLPTIDRARMNADLAKSGVRPLSADYPDATWTPSPNFSDRNGTRIQAVTIHDTEGGFAGSLSWLTSTQSEASAHYIVRSVDGYTVQMVREADKAWHVRTENPYTIGIEHEGYARNPDFFTPQMYAASATLTRHLLHDYSIPLDRVHVKGHIDFPNNTHTDPGGWWDWPGYYRLIAGSPSMAVVLDPFEDDVVGWWQPEKSGSTAGIDTGLTSFRIVAGAAYTGGSGGEIRYAFSGTTGGLVRIFRSGHGTIEDGLLNVGSSGYLSLMVDGDGSGNAIEAWFYEAGTGNRVLTGGTIDWHGWREIRFDLKRLGTGGPFRFHSIVIRQTSGGATSGRIAVDDLAHRTLTAGVETERRDSPATTALSIAAADIPPAGLRGRGHVRIANVVGEIVAEHSELPALPLGSWLRPGFYLLLFDDGAIPLLLSP